MIGWFVRAGGPGAAWLEVIGLLPGTDFVRIRYQATYMEGWQENEIRMSGFKEHHIFLRFRKPRP